MTAFNMQCLRCQSIQTYTPLTLHAVSSFSTCNILLIGVSRLGKLAVYAGKCLRFEKN